MVFGAGWCWGKFRRYSKNSEKNRSQIISRSKSEIIYSIYSACSRNWSRPRKWGVAIVWNRRLRGATPPNTKCWWQTKWKHASKIKIRGRMNLMRVIVQSPIFILPKRENVAHDFPIISWNTLSMRRNKPLGSPRIQLLVMPQFKAVREDSKI